MWWNLLIFGVIGLLAGAAGRVFYPGRQPLRILVTMLHGMIGSLLGGLLSWVIWPEVDGQFSSGALVMSLLGALLALMLWPGVMYLRNRAGVQEPLP